MDFFQKKEKDILEALRNAKSWEKIDSDEEDKENEQQYIPWHEYY